MRFVDILYFLFLLTLSLDPTGFHSRLKDLLFVVLVIYGVIYCLRRQQYLASINRITILGLLLIPLWGMFIAYITDSLTDVSYAMSQVRSMFYISIFFFAVTMRIDVLLKMVWVNGIILAVLTLVLFFLSELGGMFLAVIYDYCNRSGNFLMAYQRDFLGFMVNGLYFKAGSLIIFSFVYNLYQYKGRFKLLLSIILFLSLMVMRLWRKPEIQLRAPASTLESAADAAILLCHMSRSLALKSSRSKRSLSLPWTDRTASLPGRVSRPARLSLLIEIKWNSPSATR